MNLWEYCVSSSEVIHSLIFQTHSTCPFPEFHLTVLLKAKSHLSARSSLLDQLFTNFSIPVLLSL